MNKKKKNTKQFNKVPFVEVGSRIIKPGMRIKLCDKMGESYKETEFYHSDVKNRIDFLSKTDKDFLHIRQYYFIKESADEICIKGNLHRVFSDSTFEIKFLAKSASSTFIYTDYLEINLFEALETFEIILLEDCLNMSNQVEVDLLTDLTETEELFDDGLITQKEYSDVVLSNYRLYMRRQNKWSLNYRYNIDGTMSSITRVH